MHLRMLGCHGGETPQHRTTCFLFDGRLAVDAGAITATLSLDEQLAIDHILVTHAHLDHVKDLATLADNIFGKRKRAVEIVGTKGTLDTLRKHFFNDRIWPDFTALPSKRA